MRAAAEFAGLADVKDAHRFAVALAEEHDGAGVLGFLNRKNARRNRNVAQNFSVDDAFDFSDLFGRNGLRVGEVEARRFRSNERALLGNLVAEHRAQRKVHEVSDGVVAFSGAAAGFINVKVELVAHGDGAFGDVALHARHGSLHAEGVEHLEERRVVLRFALVAHLAAGFGVEGRAVEDGDAFAAGFDLLNGVAVDVERNDFGVLLDERFVAREDRVGARIGEAGGHLELR